MDGAFGGVRGRVGRGFGRERDEGECVNSERRERALNGREGDCEG